MLRSVCAIYIHFIPQFYNLLLQGGDVVFALLDVWKHSGSCNKVLEKCQFIFKPLFLINIFVKVFSQFPPSSVPDTQQNQTEFESSIDINTLMNTEGSEELPLALFSNMVQQHSQISVEGN